jgi:peptide/nickel transport system ATP-binding protein/oligopeptide transport system ATP-binding protein
VTVSDVPAGDRVTPGHPVADAEPDRSPRRAAPTLVEVRDLRVHFSTGHALLPGRASRIRAVDGVTFEVQRGETLGLVGESGSGKTTTGRAVVRLLDPTAGTILFDGIDVTHLSGGRLRALRRRFQMVFQDPYSSLDPRMTVGSIIAEPLAIHGLASGAARRARVIELLAHVGLPPDSVNRFPHEFSGGQRQRVGVARALAVEPQLIVADEPISALDVSVRAQIINLLTRIQREFGLSYIIVAHDLSVVRHVSDRVAVMYLGRIVELAPASRLYARPRHPYTVALLSAVPVPDPAVQRSRRRIILTGELPDPATPLPGCRFHTRCFLYERLGRPERCRDEEPPLADVEPGHLTRCHFTGALTETADAVALAAEVHEDPAPRPAVEGTAARA